jgi:hypothetical protein
MDNNRGFSIVAALIVMILSLVMVYYANKSDRLVDDYANGNLTLNVEKTGWTAGRDSQGNIVYKQNNYECTRVK